MKTCILSLFIFITVNLYSQQSGWFWINPKYSSEHLQDICAIDQDNAFIVGNTSTVLKTTDAGVSWSNPISSSTNTGLTTANLFASSFINHNTGWVVGINGVNPNLRIFKTTNSGINWLQQGTDISQYWDLLDVFFINENTGWGGGKDYIIKTTNGGANWIPYTSLPPQVTINAIFFANVNTGWALQGTRLFKSTDSGNSWFLSNTFISQGFSSVYFIDENTGFLAGGTGTSAVILKTVNGGASWTTKLNGFTIGLRSITFKNQFFGWAVGGSFSNQQNLIVKTTDGGESWSFSGSDSTEFLGSVSFLNSNTGIAVGYYGKILRTVNGGLSWTSTNNRLPNIYNRDINEISFSNDNVMWLASRNGTILSSSNNGQQWETITLPTTQEIDKTVFFNAGSGYAMTSSNIFKTTNSGITWQTLSFNNRSPSCMFFSNVNTGWVGAYWYTSIFTQSSILRTTNGGVGWDSVLLPQNRYIDNIMFFDNQTGWLTCRSPLNSFIMKTIDGGLSWNIQYQHFNNKVLDMISIVNSNFVWMAADNDNLLRTTNGGLNWQLLSFGFPESRGVNSLQFKTSEIGWAIVGYPQAQIVKTTNGGSTWIPQFNSGIAQLRSLYFKDITTGWAAGPDGILIKTTNGGETITNIMGNYFESPLSFSLSQNYPNPFNPVTNIKFNIPNYGLVKITIYDITGREIAQLVNQQMQAGSYSADWDASNYPSGVYFYKLETDGFVDSKKMVLVK